jgi:hypothetical protein
MKEGDRVRVTGDSYCIKRHGLKEKQGYVEAVIDDYVDVNIEGEVYVLLAGEITEVEDETGR